MAYTPTQWSPGDSITSAKLNKIENGIADNNGGIFWVTGTVSGNIITLNKTMREIIEAIESKIILIKTPNTEYDEGVYIYICTGWGYYDGSYFLYTVFKETFYASSLDDYPTNQEPSSGSDSSAVLY